MNECQQIPYLEELEEEAEGSKKCFVSLHGLPGGPETFVQIVNFCYGLPLELNVKNIGPLFCAGGVCETESFNMG